MVDLPAAEARFTIEDASGSTAIVTLSARTSATLAEVRAAALVQIAHYNAITLGTVPYFTIQYSTHLSDAAGAAGAVRERRAVFVFTTTMEDQYYVFTLPTLRGDLADEFGQIDPAQPAIAAIADAIINGPWCNPFGYDVVALDSVHYEFMP